MSNVINVEFNKNSKDYSAKLARVKAQIEISKDDPNTTILNRAFEGWFNTQMMFALIPKKFEKNECGMYLDPFINSSFHAYIAGYGFGIVFGDL